MNQHQRAIIQQQMDILKKNIRGDATRYTLHEFKKNLVQWKQTTLDCLEEAFKDDKQVIHQFNKHWENIERINWDSAHKNEILKSVIYRMHEFLTQLIR